MLAVAASGCCRTRPTGRSCSARAGAARRVVRPRRVVAVGGPDRGGAVPHRRRPHPARDRRRLGRAGAPARPGDLLRLPVEALALVAVALLPWRRVRAGAALVLGVALGAIVVLRAFDIGFQTILDRPFDPATDWVYLGPGVGVLGDSIGRGGGPRDRGRCRRRSSSRCWCCCRWRRSGSPAPPPATAAPRSALPGSCVARGRCTQVGSTSAAGLRVRRGGAGPRRPGRPATFAREIAADAYARTPDDRLLPRAARQGRARRVRRVLRPGRGPGLDVLARRRRRARRRRTGGCGRRAGQRAARS